jgi:predicted small lipoprotein YifL
MHRLIWIAAWCLIGVFLAGCGRGGPSEVPPKLGVRGRLVLPSDLPKPVVVQFCDDQGGIIAYTTANPPKAEFEIPGPPTGPGIAPGQYKVVVLDDQDQTAGIPKEWQNASTTPLKVSVTEATAGNLEIAPR